MEDKNLMKDIAKGDKKAFGILVKKHMPWATSYARKIVGNEASDSVQEAFVKVWINAIKWNPKKASFNTWFYTILSNTCYNFLKKQKGRAISIDNQFLNNLTDNEDLITSRQTSKALNQVIIKLPKYQKDVIFLTYFDGFSNKEVAKIINKSLKAVEMLLVKARKKIKKQLITY